MAARSANHAANHAAVPRKRLASPAPHNKPLIPLGLQYGFDRFRISSVHEHPRDQPP